MPIFSRFLKFVRNRQCFTCQLALCEKSVHVVLFYPQAGRNVSTQMDERSENPTPTPHPPPPPTLPPTPPLPSQNSVGISERKATLCVILLFAVQDRVFILRESKSNMGRGGDIRRYFIFTSEELAYTFRRILTDLKNRGEIDTYSTVARDGSTYCLGGISSITSPSVLTTQLSDDKPSSKLVIPYELTTNAQHLAFFFNLSIKKM